MRRKKKSRKGNYKSELERYFALRLEKNDFPVEYEADYLPFIQPPKKRKYKPDFKIAPYKYIETKGRLTIHDRQKHLWIKEQHPEVTVYFVFGRASNKLTKQSKVTYADWCKKHGFEYIEKDQPIPKHWR